MFMFDWKQSLYTGFPVGSIPAMTEGRAMGEGEQKKSDGRWQRQHKHLRVRTPPWKESEGCLFSGAAKGCPLWDSQADEQQGEQTADHTAELTGYQWSYPGNLT